MQSFAGVQLLCSVTSSSVFSHMKSALVTSQPTVLFSHSKLALGISHSYPNGMASIDPLRLHAIVCWAWGSVVDELLVGCAILVLPTEDILEPLH